MEIEIRQAAEMDWPAVEALLRECELPVAGARNHLDRFLVAFAAGRLAACGGYEDYGRTILLRSMAVAPAHRGAGLGARLTAQLLEVAARRGAETVILLTTTAAGYFPRFGFRNIARQEVPPELAASEELRGACPDSAVVMRAVLSAR